MSDDLQALAKILTLASWRDEPKSPWLVELLAKVGHLLPKRWSIPPNATVLSETDWQL